ncbi:MAG: hypothetical protein ACJA1C_000984 [Crocinitomicaceae bacterium]|jgi:hypothetical protein
MKETKRFTTWRNRWEDQTDMDEIEYINDTIHPEDLLIIGKLIFPELIECRSGVFLKRNFSDQIAVQLSTPEEVIRLERDINSVKMYDLFSRCNDAEESTFEQIGELLRSSWQMLLSSKHPDKNFNVQLIISENNYGPILTFHQVI